MGVFRIKTCKSQNNPFIFACVTKNKNTMKSKENIEALAAGESGDDSKCFGSGSIVCPLTNQGVAHVQIYYSLPH